MLHPARQLATRSLADYRQFLDAGLYQEVRQLAGNMQGARILHINSAPKLGGVAALLNGVVPLLNGLGMHAEWQPLEALPTDIYIVTKSIHNGLQGHPHNLKPDEWQSFEDFNRKLASQIRPDEWDFIIVHDHQLAPLLQFVPERGKATKWIWRSHVDSTQPNEQYLKKFLGYLKPYDAVIFTMRDFIFKGLHNREILVSNVAIDPLAVKNQPLPKSQALSIVRKLGIDVKRPLITQVSRFDPWKDHVGLVKAWRQAAEKVLGLQLALVADFSLRDKQGLRIQQDVLAEIDGHKDVFVFSNRTKDLEVKALVSLSNVVIQKSTREGFGLTISEALWAGVPVIGGNVGGIRLQIIDGQTGYLVKTAQQCAEKIVTIISDPNLAKRLSDAGHEHVRKNFLVPRLIRDELALMIRLKG